MYQRLFFVIVLSIFFSCRKDETSNQQTNTAYFFEATLSDGRNFKVEDANQPSLVGEIFMSASGATEFTGSAASKKFCSLPGDCFAWQFITVAQREGTYIPFVIGMTARTGADEYNYLHLTIDPGTPATGSNVSMTISKIVRGTPAKPGRFEGSFSGTFFRYKVVGNTNLPETETKVQISGKFLLPMIQ